jgi:hypothetical protein
MRMKFEVVGPCDGPWGEGDVILWRMDEGHRPLLVQVSPTAGFALPPSSIADLLRGLDQSAITIHSSNGRVRELALLVVKGPPPPRQALGPSEDPLERTA